MEGAGDQLLVTVTRLFRLRLTLLLLTALTGIGVGLLLPDVLAAAVDAAIAGRPDLSLVLLLGGLGAAQIGASIAGSLLAAHLTAATTAWLRRRLVTHLLELGPSGRHTAGNRAGDAVSRLVGDAAKAGGIPPLLVQLTTSALLSLGAVTVLAMMDAALALVFVLSLPLATLLARSHLRATADDALAYREVSGELAERLVDAVVGLRTITAAGINEAESARVLRPLPGLGVAGRGIWRTQARMVWRAGLLLPSVELAVLIAAGFGVAGGRLSVGQVLAALTYVVLGMSVVGLIPVLSMVSTARVSAGRVAEVLAEPAPRRDERLVGGGRGCLELHEVRIGSAEAPVLDRIDLVIPPGTFVAVVGRSGSGKSTLAAVLGGLRAPDAGRALLDGVELSRLHAANLRTLVGQAFDRPALIGTTVADAVGYGTSAGIASITTACTVARVHELLERLPSGYRTPLALTPLSGGEAQRVGLARALVGRPRVLILDDATSSLDTLTEAQVLDELPSECTRVVVTHRAGTAARADLVVWLHDAQVAGVASHEHLWSLPRYREVFGA